MEEKTELEKVTSNMTVNAAANLIGAYGSLINPLAALIPFLLQSLAGGRQMKRLEMMFADLDALSKEQGEKIKNLTDDQYKFVGEAIASAYSTINEEKLRMLQNAIKNSIDEPEITFSASEILARLIRDISPQEAKFVINNFHHKRIIVRKDAPSREAQSKESLFIIRTGTEEETILTGLIHLGILYSNDSIYGGGVEYDWSPIADRLIQLLKDV